MTAPGYVVVVPMTVTTADELHSAIDAAISNAEQAPALNGHDPGAPILLRFREVAALLSVSLSTVEDMAARGELPVVRIGKSVRVRRDELTAWLDALTERQRGGAG